MQRNAYLTAEDAAFIASCAGNAEAGWESTRTLIESILSLHEKMLAHGCVEYQNKTAERLLAQWPLELLANG